MNDKEAFVLYDFLHFLSWKQLRFYHNKLKWQVDLGLEGRGGRSVPGVRRGKRTVCLE